MFVVVSLFLAAASIWFAAVMIKEPRSLWSGASFLFLLLQLAIWLMTILFMNSEKIMNNRIVMLVLAISLMLVMVALLMFPAAFIGIFFVEGIKNIRREGLRPANALSLLFAAGLVVYLFIWPAIVSQIRNTWLFAFSVILSIAVTWLLGIFAVFCFSALLNLIHVKKNRHLDQVVVLGSGLMGDRLTPLLKGRIDRGIQVLGYNPDAILILSGGQGPGEDLPEGQAMAAYALEQGVDRDRVRIEDKSLNTEQNLLYSRQLFQGPKTAIVTNRYHVFRALVLAHMQGMPAIGYGSPTKWYFTLNAILREYVGYLKLTWKRQLLVIAVLSVPVLMVACVSA